MQATNRLRLKVETEVLWLLIDLAGELNLNNSNHQKYYCNKMYLINNYHKTITSLFDDRAELGITLTSKKS